MLYKMTLMFGDEYHVNALLNQKIILTIFEEQKISYKTMQLLQFKMIFSLSYKFQNKNTNLP